MKKLLALLLAGILLLSCCAASAEASESEAKSRILIAYFAVAENSEVDAVSSASVYVDEAGEARGFSRVLADVIADVTGGDLYSMTTDVDYPANIGELIEYDSQEKEDGVRPTLTGEPLNLEDYDVIFIGYPIWWQAASWVLDEFIEANDFTGKTVIPFCTSSSSGLGESGNLLAEAAGEGNWLEGKRFSSYADENEVADWVNSLPLPAAEDAAAEGSDAPVVYFTTDISPEGMMRAFEALGWTPTGNVAVKLSTGEPPASNYLRPELIKDVVQTVGGTIVECNTAYSGSRSETAMHMQVAKDHGFTDIANVDILNAEGSMELPVTGGTYLQTNLVGGHFGNYDSYVVLSHFKGHAMAGFGGAIKNISIGLGSQEGKCLIHTGGRSHTSPWGGDQTAFTESMAEAAKSVYDYLGNGERIVFINVLNRISIDCDCDGNPAEPDIHDIGILASLVPVAIDQAAIDLCFAAEGSESLQRRVERQNGLHTLEHAEEISLGQRTYTLVNIDE